MAIDGYIVCRMVIGSPAHVESSHAEYIACEAAIDGLKHICDVEEKYESLIENYIEWENAVGQYGLRQMISFEIAHIEMQAARKLIARKLFNVLASTRLYLDSLPRHTDKILGECAAAEQVKSEPGKQYDSRLSYRLMEALRNYGQHAALPIHGVRTSAKWHRDKEPHTISFNILPTIDRDELARDDRFKRSVLNEILALPNVELKTNVRDYIEGISAIHHLFRKTTESQRNLWIEQLDKPIDRFLRQFPDEPQARIGLSILPIDEKHLKAGEEVYISGPIVDYLAHMQKKYSRMVNFSKRTVAFG